MSGDEYLVYGPPFSLFTRKLEAAFQFYGAPVRREMPDKEVGKRAGTHQVPVLVTPGNWAVADTTPILQMMDGLYPARRLFPLGPAGVLTHIVEEVLDEWCARVMVHYRWHYPENTRAVIGAIVGKELSVQEAMESPLAQWGPRACRATGTESEHQQREAEREYLEMLGALEAQLGSTRYALGDRPTAVDAILLGGLRAHTNHDPIPELSSYPRVLAWDADTAVLWDGGGDVSAPPEVTPFAAHLLERARDQYRPFVLGNRRALAEGAKAFVVETYGEEVSYLTRPYPELSRRMVVQRIRHQLDDAERAEVLSWLDTCGLVDCFHSEE